MDRVKVITDRNRRHLPAEGEPLREIKSKQLTGIQPGDVVWLLEVRGRETFLIGRLKVGQVRRLPSDECAIEALRDSAEPRRRLSLKRANLRMEFVNEEGNVWGTAFTPEGGVVRIKGKPVRAVQTGRVLVASSGENLERLWNKAH